MGTAPAPPTRGSVPLRQLDRALVQTFLNPTPAADDGFGYSVAALGSNVLVGAPFDDTGTTNAGAVYLFDGSTGALLRTFQQPTPGAGDNFGYSVATLGNNVLVGAPFNSTGATNAGTAYLFDGSTGLCSRPSLTPSQQPTTTSAIRWRGGQQRFGRSRYNTHLTPRPGQCTYLKFDRGLLRTFLNPRPPSETFSAPPCGVGNNVLLGHRVTTPWAATRGRPTSSTARPARC